MGRAKQHCAQPCAGFAALTSLTWSWLLQHAMAAVFLLLSLLFVQSCLVLVGFYAFFVCEILIAKFIGGHSHEHHQGRHHEDSPHPSPRFVPLRCSAIHVHARAHAQAQNAHTHTHTHTHTLSLTLTLSLSLSHSRTHTHSLSLSLSHSLTHTHSRTHTLVCISGCAEDRAVEAQARVALGTAATLKCPPSQKLLPRETVFLQNTTSQTAVAAAAAGLIRTTALVVARTNSTVTTAITTTVFPGPQAGSFSWATAFTTLWCVADCSVLACMTRNVALACIIVV